MPVCSRRRSSMHLSQSIVQRKVLPQHYTCDNGRFELWRRLFEGQGSTCTKEAMEDAIKRLILSVVCNVALKNLSARKLFSPQRQSFLPPQYSKACLLGNCRIRNHDVYRSEYMHSIQISEFLSCIFESIPNIPPDLMRIAN